MLTQPQREDLRYAVREQLAVAQTVALTAEMVKRRVERSRLIDFPFELADVQAALSLLVSLTPPQATATDHPLGASKYYQATAAGVFAHERGQSGNSSEIFAAYRPCSAGISLCISAPG